MKFELRKDENLSGDRASIYNIYINELEDTLFNQFVNENINLHKSETIDIIDRLISIGKDTGARDKFFKLYEGNPGDGVCALYDEPDTKLRLYCIRFGKVLLIIGGGGIKTKEIKALQEDKKLKEENYFLRKLSIDITQRIKDKIIEFENDGMDITGELEFEM